MITPSSKEIEIAGQKFQINPMTPKDARWVFHLFVSTAMKVTDGSISKPWEMPITAEKRVQAAVDGMWTHCVPVIPPKLFARVQHYALLSCRVCGAKGYWAKYRPVDLTRDSAVIDTLIMESVKWNLAPILLAAELKTAAERRKLGQTQSSTS